MENRQSTDCKEMGLPCGSGTDKCAKTECPPVLETRSYSFLGAMCEIRAPESRTQNRTN